MSVQSHIGVVGRDMFNLTVERGVRKSIVSQSGLESHAVEGNSPVDESDTSPSCVPEYCGTRGTP